MPKAISVHVGLNHVDAAAYDGWDGTLAGCVNDAHDLAAVAAAEGYRTSVLTDRQATASGVLSAIRGATNRLSAGDVFLLTFAGHGGQLEDVAREGEGPRGYDATWVCWDRQLLDDEVHAALAGFAADVRVVIISDATRCSTVTRHAMAPSPPVRTPDGARRARMIPAAVAGRDASRRHSTYTRARRNARAELRRAMAQLRTLTRRQAMLRKPTACIATRVVLLAGCQDNQVAYDGPGNGVFTAALLAVWNRGRFDGTYPEFLSAVRARLVTQTPDYLTAGLGNQAWEATRPFTVEVAHDLQTLNGADPTPLRATR